MQPRDKEVGAVMEKLRQQTSRWRTSAERVLDIVKSWKT